MQLYTVPEAYIKPHYIPTIDRSLRSRQITAVYNLMRDHKWRTLEDISDTLQQPIQSVSARLRDLRKAKFGGYVVEREVYTYKPLVFVYRVDV